MPDLFAVDFRDANQKRTSAKLACASASKTNLLSRRPADSSARTIEPASQPSEGAKRDSPGLLLLDTLLEPLYVNEEAVSILFYPKRPCKQRLDDLLVQRIDSLLPKQAHLLCSKCSNEFVSDKRHYRVHVLALKSYWDKGVGPTMAVLLERNRRASLDLSQISRRFRLTQRQSEALELLMHGYTTRQIASRMRVSPNTAKTFLSYVMYKTGACSRAAVLAKLLQIAKGASR